MADGIKPLAAHLAEVEARGSALRRRTTRAARAMSTEDRDELARAADAIMEHYAGVSAEASFADASGAVFDAVPVEQQAAFRRSGEAAPAAPRGLPGWEPGERGAPEAPEGRQIRGFAGRADRFGNPQRAPGGTVPLRREDPEDALRRRGLTKGAPGTAASAAASDAVDASEAPLLATGTNHHRYVFVRMGQGTRNLGGYAHHSAQRVPIDQGKGQIFSLSQQWYMLGTQSHADFASGGSNTGVTDPLLTVEFGTHCMPQVFGTPGPTLWVGSTNNGYNFNSPKGGFYYNTTPGSGFVQTNGDWGLGMDLSPFGTLGGRQYYLGMGARLESGRWWIYVGGGAASDAVGYYPASWWTADGAPNGATMAQRADRADWGAETSSNSQADGRMHYPPMGHRAPASEGWRRAAYIRNMIYYGDDGATRAVPAMTSVASLSDLQPGQSAARHTPNLGLYGASYGYAEPWARTLWFGGPGAVYDSNTEVVTINPNPV